MLMKAGDPGDSMFVIARGTVKVIIGNNIVVDILGPGSVIGEMAVLSGVPRTATITADTPVTALSIKADGMQDLMSSSKELEEKLWNLAGVRFAENLLSKIEPYQSWRQIQFREWLADGKIVTRETLGKEMLDLREHEAVIIAGTCFSIGEEKTALQAPAVIHIQFVNLADDARVYIRAKERAFD
ncbi:MAG TPA: cyclic nucleotide-binding domain-containing protein [Flavobacteriales bacterium]|nr:cyclic nucleotide-binding domain-containing protein [Flavobacteriales bacterium]